MESPYAQQASKLRRRRLLLRAVQAVVVLLAILFAVNAKVAYDQRRAVDRIRELGGSVVFDYQVHKGERYERAPPPSPTWLRRIFGDHFLSKVVWVNLSLCEFDDADLAALRPLSDTTAVSLYRTAASDGAVSHLVRLPALAELNLAETQVTDASVASLRQIPSLRQVNVTRSKVTSSGLRELRESGMEILNAGR